MAAWCEELAIKSISGDFCPSHNATVNAKLAPKNVFPALRLNNNMAFLITRLLFSLYFQPKILDYIHC